MIGESCFQIDFRQKGSFRLIDNSHFGHDKLPDSQRPIMFYAGDGVSDLSAAKETDLLFAKKGHGKALPPKDETGNWVLTTL
jgi:2-hydroxy-3-keto-5-methylthiopentenyl-1-phosphate phosphatase